MYIEKMDQQEKNTFDQVFFSQRCTNEGQIKLYQYNIKINMPIQQLYIINVKSLSYEHEL